MAEELQIPIFIEISVKEGLNIEAAITELIKHLMAQDCSGAASFLGGSAGSMSVSGGIGGGGPTSDVRIIPPSSSKDSQSKCFFQGKLSKKKS